VTDRERANELWLRLLSVQALEGVEERALLEVLASDAEFRRKLLDDAQLDGVLRGMGWSREDEDAFVGRFSDSLFAKEATGFIKRLEPRLEQTPPPREARKSTRGQRPPRAPDRGIWPFVLVAAGLLIGIFAVVTVFTSESGRKEEGRRRQVRKEEGVLEVQHERLREIERKREELSRPPAQQTQDPGEEEKRKQTLEELKNEKERIEREMREAIDLARKAERPAPAERPRLEEKPVAPQDPPPAPKPSAGTEAIVATVERVEGAVSIVGKSGKYPARPNQGIPAGQGVETGAKSLLVLIYPDGTRLEVEEQAEARELKGEGGKRLFVDKGAVKAWVSKQPNDQPMVLATPHGEAKVLGTTLRLVVDPDARKGSKLEVEEGKVELRGLAGKAVLVESGHYAVAAAGVELAVKPTVDDPTLLIAHWTFDEPGGANVLDAGSRGLAGLLKNGTSRVAGRYGSALRFDGVDDLAEIPSDPTLEGMGAITVSAWVLVSKRPPKSFYASPVAKDLSYRFSLDPNGGMSFVVATDNNAWYSDGTGSVSHALPLNAWCHVAGTYDGAWVRTYANGVLGPEIGTKAISGGIVQRGSPLTLAKGDGGNTVPFQGLIDDLRIYRRALTATEIRSLAASRVKPGSK